MPTTSSTRRPPRVTIAVLLFVGAALLVLLLYDASVHTFAGDSDGATVILEGQAMSAGHLTLHGWSLTLESFWSIDASVYAAVIRVVGLHADLLHVVPALIATLVVLLGGYLAARERAGLAAVVASATVVALLGLPSRDLAYFFLAGPLHVGTALWCLVAFAGLERGRPGWGAAVAMLFLGAGVLGDFMTVAIGIIPVFLAGLVAMATRRDWRAGVMLVLAAPVSVLVALVVRLIAREVGTFAIVNRSFPVSRHQIAWNIVHIPALLSELLGFGSLGVGLSPAPMWLQAFRLVGVAVFTLGVVATLAGTVRAIVRPTRAGGGTRTLSSIDVLLLFGFFGDLATFVVFTATSDPGDTRYLTPGVIFGAILAGRVLSRSVPALRDTRTRRFALAAAAVVAGAFGIDVASYLVAPTPKQSASELGAFLQRRGLTEGVGDYWSASIVTVETAGGVTVRPITADLLGHLHRYDRQSSAAWYAGQSFQFFVYDTAHPLPDVNATFARAAFGPVEHTYRVGPYRVLLWQHALSFSPALPPQPDPLDINLTP